MEIPPPTAAVQSPRSLHSPYSLTPARDAAASFAELEELKAILLAGSAHFDVAVVAEAHTAGPSFPLYTASIGSADPRAPAVGFFGGIHGLERIGTQLILHYLRALLFRLEWDELLHRQLEKIRLVFMPIVNPGGMWAHKRANPQGVDLMRNAPQRAEGHVPFLAGGQVVGFVGFDRSRDAGTKSTVGEIWALYVQPEHWRKGAGLALWDGAREGLKDEGCTQVTLWVLLRNERALAFYEHAAGFKREMPSLKTVAFGSAKLEEIRLKRAVD